jgi:hypothetical protein
VVARVEPRDIDQVRAGLPAQVRLTAQSGRTRAPMRGTVLDVSAAAGLRRWPMACSASDLRYRSRRAAGERS